MEPPDLPSADKRLACSQTADVLGGQKPPAGLAELLAAPTFLQVSLLDASAAHCCVNLIA